MRHEKFSRLTTIRKMVREGDLLKIDNLDNLQYMNIEVVKVKPEFGSWVSHTCHHNELIRELPEENREPVKFKIHRTGRLADCRLWLGICPVCYKYVIGVQQEARPKPKQQGAKLYDKYSSGMEAEHYKKRLEQDGRTAVIKRGTDGSYKLYVIE